MLVGHFNFAQSQDSIPSHSLSSMDYDELYANIQNEQDSLKRKLYLSAFLQKAKGDNDFDKIVSGYKNYLPFSSFNLRMVYGDSIVSTAVKSHDSVLLASSYFTKGGIFYGMKMHQKAMKYYLKADTLAKNSDAPAYLQNKINYGIGNVQYYLRHFKEALKLLKPCLKFFKDNYNHPYLITIHSIGLCYKGLGNYYMSNHYNQLGLDTGKSIGVSRMDPYFIHSQGVNAYYLKSYNNAIKLLNSVLPEIDKNKDFANVILGKYYIGMSLWGLNRIEEAITYLEDVDQAFKLKNYTKPEFKKGYKLLIEYYTDKNNLERKSFYTNRLITFDSVIHARYKSLSSTVHNDYNMAKLESEKRALHNKWTELKWRGLMWKILVVLLFTFILWWKIWSIGGFSKVYKSLIHTKERTIIGPRQDVKGDSEMNIPQETVEAICKRLTKFEDSKEYLKDISLERMAAKFETNSKYLSKVILDSRKKPFPTYMNDLKIEELLVRLNNDKQSRKYSYKALAQMVGLGSDTRLTRAFKLRTNTTVSSYIKQLEEKEKKQQ